MHPLPAWGTGNLPEPPPVALGNILRVIGPDAILYYWALLVFPLWGCVAIALADPLTLILIGATLAGANLVLLPFHALAVNRKCQPPALRPSRWRQAGLVLSGLFFLSVCLLALAQKLGLTPT